MERILIIGTNGCGKTTMAKEMASRLDLPLVHLDSLYWKDNWTPSGRDEFRQALAPELTKPRWILDGNMISTFGERLPYADTVVWLDFPAIQGALGCLKRSLQNLGRSRDDMGPNCPERVDWKFIFSVLQYNRKNTPRFRQMLAGYPSLTVIRLTNRREVRAFLDSL
ncbi:MAG: AAA family ATPase [Clostridia bacterium]|nr:AAA family ATPase [Clostridia bacterium]